MQRLVLTVPPVLSQAALKSQVSQLVEPVKEGRQGALEMYMQGRYLQGLITAFLDEIKRLAIVEAEQYHRQERNLAGVAFEVRTATSKVDYAADEEYARLLRQLEARKTLLSEAEKNGLKANPETGEELPVLQRIPFQAASLVISFPAHELIALR